MHSTSNRKQPCRFFLQGRCNRGSGCKWPHNAAAAGEVNHTNNFPRPTNFNAPPIRDWEFVRRNSQSPDIALAFDAAMAMAGTGETHSHRVRAPSLPRTSTPQAHVRSATDNTSTRGGGGGSRGRGRRGRPTTKEKGKGPAHGNEQDTGYLNSGASSSSADPHRLGNLNRGRSRGRRGSTRSASGSANQPNPDTAAQIEDVGGSKRWNSNMNVRL